MHWAISSKIQLGATLNPLKDAGNVPAVDEKSNLENLYSKVDKIGDFWKTGERMKIQQDIFQILQKFQDRIKLPVVLLEKLMLLRHIETKKYRICYRTYSK